MKDLCNYFNCGLNTLFFYGIDFCLKELLIDRLWFFRFGYLLGIIFKMNNMILLFKKDE